MFSAGKEACASLVAGTSNAGDVADKSPEKVEKRPAYQYRFVWNSKTVRS